MSVSFSLPDPAPALAAAVVVPARDESARIGACINALACQDGVSLDSYEVIVVLDGCRDGTGNVLREVSRKHPHLSVHSLELSVQVGVGRARRLGMDLACARLLGLGREDGLIASTDADSIVAVDWLAMQLALTNAGARAIGGHIELDPEESKLLDVQTLAERERNAGERLKVALRESASGTAVEHHQFSGASLALTARTYESCGGLPVRAALEDEALEDALRAHGVAIHRSRLVHVRTSARTGGRAPRGLARDLARADWRARRSYRAEQFPLDELLERKDRTIGLVLPAREVAATIGPIAEHVLRLRDAGLLDEVLLVDAASKDGTARLASDAGLAVVQEDEVSAEFGPALGKGDAMWRGLAAVDCEIVAFADTDTTGFTAEFLTGLLGPLVCDPEVQLVKGFFERPFCVEDTLVAGDGGRVTELMARPLLNLHAPELAVFDQPLAGETAGRRELLERLAFSAGYGVEIAMLIDAWRLIGLDGLAQVDLGVRQNRHQPLRELSAMAYAVLVAAQTRFLGEAFTDARAAGTMLLPALHGEDTMENRHIVVEERPALADLRRARALAS